MKGCIGVIGGSGVYEIKGLRDARWTRVETPRGVPSDAILTGWPGNAAMARATVAGLPGLPGHERAPCPCGCDRALDNAILTAPDRRAPELVAKLDAVAGRVL